MRLLVPIIAILVGIAFALAIASNGPDSPPIPEEVPEAQAAADPRVADQAAADPVASADPSTSPQADPSNPAETTAADTATPAVASADGESPDVAASPDRSDASAAAASGALRAKQADTPIAPALGSDDPDSPFKLRVAFTSYGAGIRQITLADYAQFVDPAIDDAPRLPYTLINVEHGLPDGIAPAFYPYAARAVTINGQTVSLADVRWIADDITRFDDQRAAVTYRLPIVDEQGDPVAEVVRTWSLAAGSYDLELDQRVINQTDRPMNLSFAQYGQGDVLTDLGAYLGDRRMFITGHFRDESPSKFASTSKTASSPAAS